MTIKQSRLKKKKKGKIRKKSSVGISKNTRKSAINSLRPPMSILLKLISRKNTSISYIIIIIKKITIKNPAQSFQKTNISLGNFYTGN